MIEMNPDFMDRKRQRLARVTSQRELETGAGGVQDKKASIRPAWWAPSSFSNSSAPDEPETPQLDPPLAPPSEEPETPPAPPGPEAPRKPTIKRRLKEKRLPDGTKAETPYPRGQRAVRFEEKEETFSEASPGTCLEAPVPETTVQPEAARHIPMAEATMLREFLDTGLLHPVMQ